MRKSLPNHLGLKKGKEMFSKYFNSSVLTALLDGPRSSESELMELLERPRLNVSDVARLLLAFDDTGFREKVLAEASRRRVANWGNKLFLMPPLYVSAGDPERGGCLDHCVYCPWRNGNVPKEKIIRLTPDEVYAETRHLLQLGYGDVELVAATDSRLLKGSEAAQVVEAAQRAGSLNVGINFFPLKKVEDYRTVGNAGCTFAIVWQETYVPSTYKAVHPRGPKASMKYRLEAHDRALQGGIKTVGVGFLGGLADWRFETLATIEHALYLRNEYAANIIFGMPRWKSGSGIPMRSAFTPYGDEAYGFVGALYSLAMPEALPWFSTREDFELSALSAKGGGCMFTLDCSTEVGGYTRKGGAPQFPVHSRSLEQGVSWLRQRGFDPHVHLPW